MQVCILVVGTRGDVQPFVGIGKRLQRDGHRVRVATHAAYREFVCESGLEFYPLAGDPKELAAYMVKTGGHMIALNYDCITKDTPRNVQMINDILNSTWPAVSAADPDGDPSLPPFRAQAIISNPVTYGHIHVAEKLGVPLHMMFPQPWVPTQEFPHPLSNLPYKGKREWRNWASYVVMEGVMWAGTEHMVNEFRVHVLGLRKIRKGDGGRSLLLDWAIPHSFMWSAHLVPPPIDWDPALYDVIGTVTEASSTTSAYTPSPAFAAFLARGDPPIFVGFGSMVIPDAAATTRTIVDASIAANVRVVIQSSWSDMTDGGSVHIPSNVFVLGNCPHDWLFAKMAAVVHHGGAGTTAAGLLAGKPTFIVPFFGDQPFWGWAVERAQVGVRPCPIHDLTVATLAGAFRELLSPGMVGPAQELQIKMLSEDGIENAVQSFYSHLPKMECAFTPEHVATRWLADDEVQVCDGCAFVLRSRTDQAIEEYHPMEYGIVGPSSALHGMSKGTGALVHELGGAFKDLVAKPIRGYKKSGLRGAGLGMVQGIGGMVFRPISGIAQFADHVAVGVHNQKSPDQPLQCRLDERLPMRPQRKVVFSQSMATMVDVSLTDAERAQVEAALAKRVGANAVSPQTTTGGAAAPSVAPVDDPGMDHRMAVVDLPPVRSKLLRSTSFGTFHMDDYAAAAAGLSEGPPPRVRLSSQRAVVQDEEWEDTTLPFTLSICMLVVGTPQDVEAFVAIALSLAGDGHRVRVAAATRFATLVQRHASLEFVALEGNPTTAQDYVASLEDDKPSGAVWSDIPGFVASTWRAVKGPNFRADLVVAHPDVIVHVHLAERLGVPLHLLSGTPYSPTVDMPHPLVGTMTRSNDSNNYHSYAAVHSFLWEQLRDTINRFRTHELGLRPWNTRTPPRWSEWRIPISYYWSSLLLSRRDDWGDEVDVVGFVQLTDPPPYVPPPALAAALDASGLKRVYISLPSTSVHELIEMVEAMLATHPSWQALVKAGTPHTGTSALLVLDRLVVVDDAVPTAWLLDKVDVIVHQADDLHVLAHLQQTKPSVAIPVSGIERQWARHLCEMDPSTHLPPVELDSVAGDAVALAALVAALLDRTTLVSPSFWTHSIESETKLAVRRAVASIYKHMPVDAMACDLLPHKLARVYDPELELRMCYEAAYVVNKSTNDRLVKYTPVQYGLDHLPQVSIPHIGRPHAQSLLDSLRLVGLPPNTPELSHDASATSVPIETSKFWSSKADELDFRRRVNDAYEQFLANSLFGQRE